MFHDPHRNAERASLVAQTVKNLPAVRETQVRSLGREDPLEKEMAPHSSILAWRIPWMEKPGGLQSLVFRANRAINPFKHTAGLGALSRVSTRGQH